MANTTTPKNATNRAPGAKAAVKDDLPNFDDWQERQVGFSPYWTPTVGDWCFGQVIARDDRNPDFVRYLFKAYKDMECRTGPNNDNAEEGPTGEEAPVKKGETFTMSVYHSLSDEFDFQLWLQKKAGIDIPIRVDALKKVATKTEGRKVWKFRVRCSPEHKALLDSKMSEWKRLLEGGEERPALEE